MKNELLRVGLVATGSGTDANSLMDAEAAGRFVEKAEIASLLSTKAGQGCLDKAKAHNKSTKVIDRRDYAKGPEGQEEFEAAVAEWVDEYDLDIIILVGCIHHIPTNLVSKRTGRRIVVLNIHPARREKHGGHKMYGLAVHEHVLSEVLDQIARGFGTIDSTFYTHPEIHRVIENYDHGDVIIQVAVPIPKAIIVKAQTDLAGAAEDLKDVVLPIEWLMLPAALQIVIQLIQTGNEPSL